MPYPYWIGSQKDLQSRRAIAANTTSETSGGPLPIAASLRLYLHTESSRNGAPNAPTGCATLSTLVPDATDAASVAGGHVSSANAATRSVLNKPAAKDATVDLAGTAPTSNPGGSRVFGWFSDKTFTGTFSAGTWKCQIRDDDNGAGVTGTPRVNVFAATTRSFSGTFRFLGQLTSATDWWDGATTVSAATAALGAQTLSNEYLFCEVWCVETVIAGGNTLTLHQEGSDLSDANRSWVFSPPYAGTTAIAFPTSTAHGDNIPNPSFDVRIAQNRVARASNTPGEYGGIIPQLIGQDQLPPGDVHANNPFNAPNAAQALLVKQAFVARQSADAGQYNAVLPFTVVQSPLQTDFDLPTPSFAVVARQAFVARQSADAGNWNGPLPLIGADVTGPTIPVDAPNPSFAILSRQATVARTAADFGQFDTPLPTLFAQDALPSGTDSQDLPPRGAARARDYSVTASFFHGLDGQDALAVGAQSQDLPARAPARARDYSFTASYLQGLIGKDSLPSGAQVYALPTPAPARARDYSIAASFPLELIGQDAFAPGAQLSGNTPATARRAITLTEPGTNQTVVLSAAAPSIPAGQAALDQQYRTAPRARDYSVTASFFHGLDGQDARTVGGQLSGNTPAAPRRAVDYTWVQSFPLSLIAQDAMVAGEQLSGNTPNTAARARDYTWLQSLSLETIGPGQQFPVGQAVYDLPTPAVLRARDYSFNEWYFQGLIGQDALAPGQQLSGNTPATARRASTLSEPGVNLTIVLTAAPPVIPYGLSTALTALTPTGALRAREYGQTSAFFHGLDGKDALPTGRSTAATELPPKAPARARDYSFVAPFPLTLVGKDTVYGAAGEAPAYDWQLPPRAAPRASTLSDPGVNVTLLAPTPTIPVGEQVFELPAKAQPRARDYSFSAAYFAGLIGKDALPSGHSTANTDLPPKAAARARDYTWLQTLPLHVYQQLPPGASTESSVVPPRGPARSRDYTFLRSLPTHLIGQDTLYGAPGEVPAYDWQLPPRTASRLSDYTLVVTAPYGSGIPPRDLLYTLGTPGSAWQAGNVPPSSHWLAGLPSQPSEEWLVGVPSQ